MVMNKLDCKSEIIPSHSHKESPKCTRIQPARKSQCFTVSLHPDTPQRLVSADEKLVVVRREG
jgi:hypothetical protein